MESRGIYLTNLTPENGGSLATTQAERNPAKVYLAGLAPGGRPTMAAALDRIAQAAGFDGYELMPWQALRYQHTQAIRAKLAEQYKPATVNRMLSALRGVLLEAWRLGLLTAEEYHAARDVKSVKGSTIPAGRELSPGELAALLEECQADTTPAGARDAALIAVMYACGLRRAEAAGLALEDYDSAAGRLVIRGKGRKERTAFIPAGAGQALADWLAIRGQAPGPLFWPVDKGGSPRPRRITPQAVYLALEKRRKAAGVQPFTPHDLRRTFVSDLLDAGADIATVQKMAGHANVQTTARYDRRPEQAKQKAAGLLHIPYRRK